MKWEYKLLVLTGIQSAGVLAARLTSYGAEGWELCGKYEKQTLIFKRPQPEEPPGARLFRRRLTVKEGTMLWAFLEECNCGERIEDTGGICRLCGEGGIRDLKYCGNCLKCKQHCICKKPRLVSEYPTAFAVHRSVA